MLSHSLKVLSTQAGGVSSASRWLLLSIRCDGWGCTAERAPDDPRDGWSSSWLLRAPDQVRTRLDRPFALCPACTAEHRRLLALDEARERNVLALPRWLHRSA